MTIPTHFNPDMIYQGHVEGRRGGLVPPLLILDILIELLQMLFQYLNHPMVN